MAANLDLSALLKMAKGMVKEISFSFSERGIEVSVTVPSGKQSTVLYSDGDKIDVKIVEQIAALFT